MDALLEYLAGTALPPASDLAARVQARIDREPDRTPPRRYVLALARLRPRLAAGAFRQLLGVIRRRGSFPVAVRIQALGLVIVTVIAMTTLGLASAAGVQRLLEDRVDHPPPAPTERIDLDDRSAAPSSVPSPRTQRVSPSPSTLDATPRPTDGLEHPGRTVRPTPADADPGRDTAATPKPTRRPTHRPKPTDRADATARPTRRPRPTERPEPTETPETDDGGDDHAGDGDDDPEGGEETEPPDDIGTRPSRIT